LDGGNEILAEACALDVTTVEINLAEVAIDDDVVLSLKQISDRCGHGSERVTYDLLLEIGSGCDGKGIQAHDLSSRVDRAGTCGETLVLELGEHLLDLGVRAEAGTQGEAITMGIRGIAHTSADKGLEGEDTKALDVYSLQVLGQTVFNVHAHGVPDDLHLLRGVHGRETTRGALLGLVVGSPVLVRIGQDIIDDGLDVGVCVLAGHDEISANVFLFSFCYVFSTSLYTMESSHYTNLDEKSSKNVA